MRCDGREGKKGGEKGANTIKEMERRGKRERDTDQEMKEKER